jgi:hypothetical protein
MVYGEFPCCLVGGRLDSVGAVVCLLLELEKETLGRTGSLKIALSRRGKKIVRQFLVPFILCESANIPLISSTISILLIASCKHM